MSTHPELERRFKILALLVIRIEEEIPEDVSETFNQVLDLTGSMIEADELRKAEEGIFKLETLIIEHFEKLIEES
ncbi:hypothetical protein [Leptospira levettii]|uniref:hypothetical protein n=1 Tax=Leptospira levettii TaxID=2023178 RepID=UPI003EB7EF65